jgi:hypothetical protein
MAMTLLTVQRMTKRVFNPEQDAISVHGSDGTRFIQDGHCYGAPPLHFLISAPGDEPVDEPVDEKVDEPADEPVDEKVDEPADDKPAPLAVLSTMEELEAQTVAELRVLAKSYGVNGRNKDDLIAEILAAQAKVAAE